MVISLWQTSTPARREWLLVGWCLLLAALTVFVLSTRPSTYSGLALMSVGMVLSAYCVLPLPLSRQALLAVPFSIVVLVVARWVEMNELILVALGSAFVM